MSKQSFFDKQPLIAFLVGLSVALLGTALIKEDIASTAETLFVYFPIRFGVTPSVTRTGAVFLGVFTSLVQAIAIGVATSKNFTTSTRISAGVLFIIFLPFDNWTDIVHRSGYLSGNIWVAVATTIIFYTFGSEVASGLGWLAVALFFRPALSQLMLIFASVGAFFKVLKTEWRNYTRVAANRANRYVEERRKNLEGENPRGKTSPTTTNKTPTAYSPYLNDGPNSLTTKNRTVATSTTRRKR